MNKNTRAALTIYSEMSFGISLDELVDFANKIQTNETFVYQSVLYLPESFIREVKEPAQAWLEKNLPKYKGIIDTYQTLNEALHDLPKADREAKLNAFLDTYDGVHYENTQSLNAVMKAGEKIYVEATLLKQWGFGEYASEPDNGFTIQIGDNKNDPVDVILDHTKILY